jgi:hypothetical protein
MDAIPFDEIAAGTSARTCIIENLQYLSIRDTLMHVCGLTQKRANEKWERLPEDMKEELAAFCGQYRFPGPGNPTPSPVITFKGALKLVMMVSGAKAALYRSAMVKILTRYYAGDGTLLEEVEANAQSSAPVQQMARAALTEKVPVVHNEVALTNKRKLEELEIAKLEADIEARQAETKAKLAENEARRLQANHEHVSKCSASYQGMCKDTVMDERARLIFKDLYLNMALLQTPKQQAITDGAAPAKPSQVKPISLSLVAGDLGMWLSTRDLISLGVELKKRYVAKHGKAPSKHEQLCDGRVTRVNSYTEEDRPLVEQVLRWHADGRV